MENQGLPANSISSMIENKVNDYLNNPISVKRITNWNTHRRLKLLNLFYNRVYETGNTDSQGRYKYWYDVLTRYVEDEVKATDINTNNISCFSFFNEDIAATFVLDSDLRDYFKTTHEGIELNDTKEKWSAFGSTIWKKVKGGKEVKDLDTTYVLNQKAKYITDPNTGKVYSPVCEWHSYDDIDLREMEEVWFKDKIDDLIIRGGTNTQKEEQDETGEPKPESKEWEIYEYNGYVNLKFLKEVRKENGIKASVKKGDENKQVLAKIVKPVDSVDDAEILYAKEIKKMPYIEAHRGPYKGTWLRDGLISVLLENQNIANEIGNSIMHALEFASKIVFTSDDRTIVENILTDLQNGDIIKAKNFKQVDTRLSGLDQLIAKWNLNLQEADRNSKIFDISRGEQTYAGMPYKLGALLDARGSQFHNYLRQKFALSYKSVIREWLLPERVKKLKAMDIVKLTGDLKYMNRYYDMAIQGWFIRNLDIYGHLPSEMQEKVKERKKQLLKRNPEARVELNKDMWLGILKRVDVIIVGESIDLYKELQNHATFINLESDPVRRTALIERAYHLTGIDIGNLPKSEPNQLAGPVPTAPNQNMEEVLNNAMRIKSEQMANTKA